MTTAAPAADWTDVLEHIKAYFPAVAIVAAMQLDIFTPLADGPKTAQELAAALGVSSRRLLALLRSVAATNLIVSDGGRFANSALASEFLVRGRPQYMGGSHEMFSDMFSTVLAAARSVRTGAPQALHDWDQMPEEQLRAALRGLNSGAAAHGRALARTHEFSRFKTFLDVGGGGGGFAIGACEVCPGLTAQVVELPRVAQISEELVASTGLASRIRVVRHDMTAMPIAQPADAAVLRSLLQVLSADSARRVVEHVAESLRPGGEIFIIGAILDDDGLGPPGVLALNLFFLSAFQDGEAYTESEYRGWLEAAGFGVIRRAALRGGLDVSLMTARRQG
jgi:SAM-dependent methyltransferase